MKKLHLLKRTLLLFALIVGCVNYGWADSYTGIFKKISSTSDFTTGYYVVAASESASSNASYALGNTVDSNKRMTGVSVTISDGSTITNPDNAVVWYITVSGTTITMKNVSNNKYLYQTGTSSGKGMGLKDASTDLTLAGYNSSSPIGFKFTLNGASTNYFKYNTGSKWFANYANDYTTSMTPVRLFKLTHTLTYSATNGSVSGTLYGTQTSVATGASVLEGGKVTLTAEAASGYAFSGWSVEGTGSTLSSTSTNPTTFTMGTENATVTATFVSASTCANPTFTVAEGTYNAVQSVELNCPTDGATIYYTIDGSDPTTSSTEYTSAISVTQTTTIKAFAVKDGLTDSGIASATYTLKCATPEITVPDGAFLESKVVTMTSSDGASIYYTTDGSEPTGSSTTYAPSNKPSISATTTFKAIAMKSGWSNSDVATQTFTKIVPLTVAEAIAATPASGTSENKYIHGIVSAFYNTSIVGDGSNYRYYISDDGTTSGQLLVYKGKGLNNVAFSAASDLEIGDEVIVYGGLTTYSGTKEVASGNYLIKRVTKETPTFSLDITEKSLDAYTKESVDVTLTTNTDGIISCESSDEDVATVALKSENVYTITANTEGTATITIRSAASATYKPANATVSITVTDNRADAGISFENEAVETTWGESYTGQALTNNNGVAVTWSSTDEAVATVDSEGGVTILKAGETDIKATFNGNATYKAAVASYTLIVNKAEAGLSYTTTSFDIMLNDASFVAPTLQNPNGLTGITYSSNNETVAIVDENTGELAYESSAEGTAKITATFAGNDWFKAGSANYTINIIDYSKKGSKYNPYTVAEVIGMAPSSTSTPAAGQSDIYVIGYIVGEYRTPSAKTTTVLQSDFTTDANIAIADDPTTTALASSIPVNLTKTVDKTAFGNLTNHGKTIGYKVLVKGDALKYFGEPGFKNIDEISAVSVPATVTTAKYATFASPYATDFSETGITVYTAKDNATSVTLNEVASGQVPANTPVVLYKEGANGTPIDVPVIASAASVGDNDLEVSDGTTATGDDIYVLAKKSKGVGFYPWTSGSSLSAGKVFLRIAGGSAREFIGFEEGETTAISEVRGLKAEVRGEYFNLNGQRVAQPTKGLYIVNGRKVVIK